MMSEEGKLGGEFLWSQKGWGMKREKAGAGGGLRGREN